MYRYAVHQVVKIHCFTITHCHHDSELSSPRPEAHVRARRPESCGHRIAERAGLVLADLDSVCKPSALDLPGYRLHPLKGNMKGFWSISVSGNWRVTFRFDNDDVHDVNLVDHH